MSERHELSLTEVSSPFWEAAARGELVLQRCDSCQGFVWYPRAVCPHCGSLSLTWTAASRYGTVYAVSVHQRPARPELADAAPYPVVLVDLDDGVRMMARMVGIPADQVRVGQRVRWIPDPQGGRAYLFQPERPAG